MRILAIPDNNSVLLATSVPLCVLCLSCPYLSGLSFTAQLSSHLKLVWSRLSNRKSYLYLSFIIKSHSFNMNAQSSCYMSEMALGTDDTKVKQKNIQVCIEFMVYQEDRFEKVIGKQNVGYFLIGAVQCAKAVYYKGINLVYWSLSQ